MLQYAGGKKYNLNAMSSKRAELNKPIEGQCIYAQVISTAVLCLVCVEMTLQTARRSHQEVAFDRKKNQEKASTKS